MVGIGSGRRSEDEGALGGRPAIVGLTRRAELMLEILVAISHFAVVDIGCWNEGFCSATPAAQPVFVLQGGRHRCAGTYVACV